ncbi:MAG: pentapeptide repeat-containing protein [Cyanobacteria bacterium J06635_11]
MEPLADLRDSDLLHANLCDSNLYDANLTGASLHGAKLSSADLCRANLCGANLAGAELHNADLRRANLAGVKLCNASLRRADLRSVNLCNADLSNADLSGAMWHSILPQTGSFDAYKKVDGGVARLRVPARAKRVGGLLSRKCRVNCAKVISITTRSGGRLKEAVSLHDYTFVYVVGKTVSVENFCDDPRRECAPGIHCFFTSREAWDY